MRGVQLLVVSARSSAFSNMVCQRATTTSRSSPPSNCCQFHSRMSEYRRPTTTPHHSSLAGTSRVKQVVSSGIETGVGYPTPVNCLSPYTLVAPADDLKANDRDRLTRSSRVDSKCLERSNKCQ